MVRAIRYDSLIKLLSEPLFPVIIAFLHQFIQCFFQFVTLPDLVFSDFLWAGRAHKNLSQSSTAGHFLAQSAALGHLEAGAWPPAVGKTGHVTERFSEPGGHEVVEDGVDGRAQVEADSGEDVDVLEDLEVQLGPGVDVAPHQALHVERSPAKAKHNHQHAWTGQMDRRD